MNGFLRCVAIISLLKLIADMLLPAGKMHRICETVVGLVLMLCMLHALENLLFGGFFG